MEVKAGDKFINLFWEPADISAAVRISGDFVVGQEGRPHSRSLVRLAPEPQALVGFRCLYGPGRLLGFPGLFADKFIISC